jgi:hypothetical protein
MKRISGVAAGIAALMMATAMPAQAQSQAVDNAEKIRKLDIMLMVSALRCRKGADNFQADYERFSASHLAELNQASNTLKADLSKRTGAAGAKKALDKISVGMANAYGNGHPWLDCAGLKNVTRELAGKKQPGMLLAAADEYLAPRGRVTLAAGH